MADLVPYLIIIFAFGAVTTLVFVAGQFFPTQIRLQRRAALGRGSEASPNLLDGMNAFVSTYFDEKRFQIEGPTKAKLRGDLIRAGFFRTDAINYYIFARLAVVVVLPLGAYLVAETFFVGYAWLLKLAVILLVAFLAILLPDAYIARRQRQLSEKYRIAFPDLLDLMMVCVDAGLSLEASFERLSREMLKRHRELGMNLLLLGAESRTGRSTPDALDSFADRLGLDEARAFVAMLRQSIELGTDIGAALRVYSDEIRDKRLLRAEERANQLPVKMVLPLGLFIFPVILMLVLLPVIIRFMTMMP
jgi:tight adherence protein C